VTEYPFADRQRRPRPRRRRKAVRILLGLALLAATFVGGLALGEALNDGPSPGGKVTYVRTLEPLPQRPPGP